MEFVADVTTNPCFAVPEQKASNCLTWARRVQFHAARKNYQDGSHMIAIRQKQSVMYCSANYFLHSWAAITQGSMWMFNYLGFQLRFGQFEMKIKPPRQAQEWSYSFHRESIGKALSSPGIKSNKKTHINCCSSARMAGNVCANVDQIRRQGRWNNTTINGHIAPTFQECDQWQASPHMVRFFYLGRAALNPPTSLCKKLFPAIGEGHDQLAAGELSPGDRIQSTVAENAFVQVIMVFGKTLYKTWCL